MTKKFLWKMPQKIYLASIFPCFSTRADETSVQNKIFSQPSGTHDSLACIAGYHRKFHSLQDHLITSLFAYN